MEKSGATAPCGGRLRHRGHLFGGLFFIALLTVALAASPAFAAKQVISSFGSLSETGSTGGEFNNPRDVAVNESGVGPANAGDIYVADEANNRIERFDANGNFISAWGKDTISPTVNERQEIDVKGTEGYFTVTFDGQTSEPIYAEPEQFRPYGIYEFLGRLPGIGFQNLGAAGGGTSTNREPFFITFIGALSGVDEPTLTADTSHLTGSVEIKTIANGATSTSDTGTGYEICTIAQECKGGTASGEAGALDSPQSVAVDQDTGNVYVSDRGNRRIDEYDGVGNFIRSFGFDVTESGPGDKGTAYEVCNKAAGDVCKAGVAGPEVGQYGEGAPEGGFGIAVSAADGNAATGTVYLADSGNRRVDTFGLDGTKPGSFGSAAQLGEEQPRSIAVDSRGIVYLSNSNEEGEIERYDSKNVDGKGVGFLPPILSPKNEQQEIVFSGFNNGDRYKLTCPNGTTSGPLTYALGETGTRIVKEGLEQACGAGTASVAGEPPALTVSFQGALGGADLSPLGCTPQGGTGSCSVNTVVNGHAGPLLPGGPSSATAGLAVNPSGTALYVLRVPTTGPIVVQQFGPAHEPGRAAAPTAADDTLGATANFNSSNPVVKGLELNSATGRLYVASAGDADGYDYFEHPAPLANAHRIYVLDDATSLPKPTATLSAIEGVGARSALLKGEVDPKGGFVGCKFEVSTDEKTWKEVPVVPNCLFLEQSQGPQSAIAVATGLTPDTQYFVRLQVSRPFFPDYTPVTTATQSFTTLTSPPLIQGAKAIAIDPASVKVTATINPSKSPTHYVVEYGPTPALGSSTAPVEIGGGTEPVEIASVIGGLSPATQYYFKIVATNSIGPAASETLTAKTFSQSDSPAACPNERFRTGFSAKLPDCRAYEQVTPTDKYGSDAYGGPDTVQASPSGDGITSYTFTGFPGSEGFQYVNSFLSRFANGSWSTAGLNPPPQYGNTANVLAWTPDLRLSFAETYDFDLGGEGENLVMRDSTDGSRTVIIHQNTPGFGEGGSFVLGGAFDNDTKVVFEAKGLIPVTSGPSAGAEEARNIYLFDRATGDLTMIDLLPDSACATPPCVPAEGAQFPKAFFEYVEDGHVVSPSGDVIFTDRATKQIYRVRGAGTPGATTEDISASRKTNGGGPGGVEANSPQPVTWWGATPDGTKSFMTSSEELTNDANTGPEPVTTSALSRANIDGSNVERKFISTPAKWTAVDAGHIYWTDPAAGTIGRAKLDGSEREASFITGLAGLEGVAVDSGHIYWAEDRGGAAGEGTIGRATLAGGGVEKNFVPGVSNPRGVAAGNGFVYWTDSSGIGRATAAGTNPEQTIVAREGLWGIAVNSKGIYAAESQVLLEYPLAGGDVIGGEYVGGEVRGLAIDSTYMYYGDLQKRTIGRRKLDFSEPVPGFVKSVNGVFGIAVDAGHIYFGSQPQTGESPPGGGVDLYRYDASTDTLIDVVPDANRTAGTEVEGVYGYSNNGAYVYFIANADLDGSGPAKAGECAPSEYSASEIRGDCSLYVWIEAGSGSCTTAGGCVKFIAPVHIEGEVNDLLNIEGFSEYMKASRVSANGHILTFRSVLNLSTYNSEGKGEYYRYDADNGAITCLTCSPIGAAPSYESPDLKNPDLFHAPTSHAITEVQPSISRNLSPDGDRFFFQSSDKLVPGDVNGDVKCDSKEEVKIGSGPSCRDVYEWEAPGTPGSSCTTASGSYSPTSGGCIYLLSTGTGIYPSYLADISESGDTAFIFSRQQLVPADEDQLEDIYAVKVDGGLASQYETRRAPCEGDACRGAASQSPDVPGAGSSVFEGPGDPNRGTNNLRCPKGKRAVHSKGKVRCVSKHEKRRGHHKSGHHRGHQRATHKGGRTAR